MAAALSGTPSRRHRASGNSIETRLRGWGGFSLRDGPNFLVVVVHRVVPSSPSLRLTA
jgi:hypothetical protein